MEQAMETKPTTTCPACQGTAKRFAVNRNGSLRFRCVDCKKTFTEEQAKPFGKMTTPVDKAL
jgi:transposase-like protein